MGRYPTQTGVQGFFLIAQLNTTRLPQSPHNWDTTDAAPFARMALRRRFSKGGACFGVREAWIGRQGCLTGSRSASLLKVGFRERQLPFHTFGTAQDENLPDFREQEIHAWKPLPGRTTCARLGNARVRSSHAARRTPHVAWEDFFIDFFRVFCDFRGDIFSETVLDLRPHPL